MQFCDRFNMPKHTLSVFVSQYHVSLFDRRNQFASFREAFGPFRNALGSIRVSVARKEEATRAAAN